MRFHARYARPSSLLALLAACASLLGAAAQPDWSLEKAGDGIEVYTRPVPGWGLHAFRAVTRVRAKPDAALALMEDVPSYTRWFPDCLEARVVESKGPLDRTVYFVQRTPFPTRDRDSVTRYRISQDPKTGAVTMLLSAEPDLLPKAPGRIRIPRLEGTWTFTPQAGGVLEIAYQIQSDPGGGVPAWLANSFVTDEPWRTLRSMRAMLEGRP